MITFSLQSGSNGNSIYVEACGQNLIFDAGITGDMAQRRMATHDRDMNDVDALFISHNHSDHIRCAGVFHRKFGIPIYMTKKTEQYAGHKLGRIEGVRYFASGDSVALPGVTIHTIPTPHDAVDGVAFVVEAAGKQLGILTDLGHPFPRLCELLQSVDAAYLECNYDPHLLETGPYPAELRARITGLGGHLSNNEAAGLLESCGRRRPKWVAVAHLSRDNNRPEFALGAIQSTMGEGFPVHHASRYHTSECLRV